MAKEKQSQAKSSTPDAAPVPTGDSSQTSAPTTSLLFQGWLSVAVWMVVGLLLEGLLGYKAPAYLDDPQRRELFRLAHAHGTLLGAVLIVAALSASKLTPPHAAALALRIGSVMMPVGFLLAGVWHPEGDPGLGIWLVPPGALLMIFGAAAMAFSARNKL